MSRKQQRKGANGEKELTIILQGKGYNAQRGGSQTYGTIPDIVGLPGIHIEVKRREKLDMLGAIRQAQTDSERFKDGLPAIFHRSNRSPWLVTMTLEEWLVLYERGHRTTQKGDICGNLQEKGGVYGADNKTAEST